MEKITSVTALSVSRGLLAGASVGNYALFAGGRESGVGEKNTVDAYDTSLVRSTPTALSAARSALAGATVGNYALFAGGEVTGPLATVDAYNTSLVRSTPTALSLARARLAGAAVSGYAVFGGGEPSYGAGQNTVDAYTNFLARSTPTPLSVARTLLAGVTVGKYAVFAGGYSAAVDAYERPSVQLFLSQGSSYNVNGLSGTVQSIYEQLVLDAPISGWVKIKSMSYSN